MVIPKPKKCFTCGIQKELSEYYKDKKCKDGRFRECKKCCNDRCQAWKVKHPEATKRHQRVSVDRLLKDPIRHEKSLVKSRKKYVQLKKWFSDYHKKYFKKHRSEYYERANTWKKENPERYKELVKNHLQKPESKLKHRLDEMQRRLKITTTKDGSVNTNSIKKLNLSQGYKCVYCKTSTKQKYQVDHIYPLAKGGKHIITNIQITCPSCNHKKFDLLHEEFVRKYNYES